MQKCGAGGRRVQQLVSVLLWSPNNTSVLRTATMMVQYQERGARGQIVQQLVAEVEAASEAMLAGLMAKLRGPIQLPECLRIVGCLRRLAPFPEPELRRRCLNTTALTRICRSQHANDVACKSKHAARSIILS